MTSPNNYLTAIKVVGVGGDGVSIVNRMIEEGLKGVEFTTVNTDSQALMFSDVDVKLDTERGAAHGLGAGANPEVSCTSVEGHKDEIEETLRDADMVFVTAGEGGGTGTGAAPVVASTAKKSGALTVGVVTEPFDFEGKRRACQAVEGTETLKEVCDMLITIPNRRLLQIGEQDLPMMDAFRSVDEILYNGIQSIIDLIITPGMINVDLADVRLVMAEAGSVLMGVGSARGDDRVMNAATQAINSPLLKSTMDGVQGVLISVAGGSDLGLMEVNVVAPIVEEKADSDVNAIFDVIIDDNLGDEACVTVIATGFEQGSGNPLDKPAAGAATCLAAQDTEAHPVAEQASWQDSALPGSDNLGAPASCVEEECPVAQSRECKDRDRFVPCIGPSSGGLFTDNPTPRTQENHNYRGAHRDGDRDDRRGSYQASSDLSEWGF